MLTINDLQAMVNVYALNEGGTLPFGKCSEWPTVSQVMRKEFAKESLVGSRINIRQRNGAVNEPI